MAAARWSASLTASLVGDGGIAALRERVRASFGRLDCLRVDELLSLCRPGVLPYWASPMGWFIQSSMHHSEAPTSEGIEALARYLQRRYTSLRASKPILEVGAGHGRLCHLLNACGVLTAARVVASDIELVPGGQYPVERIEAASHVRAVKPEMVICAWMGTGADWTAQWRTANVLEYVLIGYEGDMPAGSGSYALTHEHPPYERVVLPEVSRHLLGIADAMPGRADAPSQHLVAVAYRRLPGMS